MATHNIFQIARPARIARLVTPLGIALVLFAACLAALPPPHLALADPGVLYVDGVAGQDLPACGTPGSPCRTISYTLGIRAGGGDTIRVAQGVYTENLTIYLSVTLAGGYEAASWTRDISRYPTVVDGSADQSIPGDFDGRGVIKPGVIRDGAEYKMWYDGVDLYEMQQVGLVTSTDGIAWTRPITYPVLTGTPGTWDEFGERAPFVLKEAGVYKMWYEGSNGPIRQLGYATSTNGIDWHKYAGNPVLQAGPDGYDAQAAAHGSVLHDGGTYKLWYHAIGDQGPIIAYATSPDGVNWTKHGPVLTPLGGSWDESGLWGPSVLTLGGTYWMWYSGVGPQGAAIGVVTSTDGLNWTRALAAPVITETTLLGDPHVISDGGRLMMWYGDFDLGVIQYAESFDGTAWTKSPANPVLTPGTLAAHWGRPVITIAAADVVLDGLTIQGGSGQEAGGVRAGPNTVIRNCLIRDNFADGSPDAWGGGGVLGAETLTIVDSVIVQNNVIQGAGGVRAGMAPLSMTNTIVAGNHGDAALHVNSTATLWNVTVTGNDAGILFNPQAGEVMQATNIIVYANFQWSIFVGGGTAQITYSDIEGGWAGAGNIDADPSFAGPGVNDYHLLAGSPAIDTGTNAGAPGADFEGDLRPLDGDLDGTPVVDMGADEFRPYTIFLPFGARNAGP